MSEEVVHLRSLIGHQTFSNTLHMVVGAFPLDLTYEEIAKLHNLRDYCYPCSPELSIELVNIVEYVHYDGRVPNIQHFSNISNDSPAFLPHYLFFVCFYAGKTYEFKFPYAFHKEDRRVTCSGGVVRKCLVKSPCGSISQHPPYGTVISSPFQGSPEGFIKMAAESVWQADMNSKTIIKRCKPWCKKSVLLDL